MRATAVPAASRPACRAVRRDAVPPPNLIVAELDGTGAMLSRFVYGTRTNIPDSMIQGTTNYRILSDHLGSPVMLLNAATGEIAETIGYDEWGNVLADTNPGLQPFRFAGGLYDRDTKLVRFGARDYDAHTGRWTTKEPLLFGGGDSNFYSYVFGDPIQMLDPTGLDSMCYDGTMLSVYDDAGQRVLMRPATSGRGG